MRGAETHRRVSTVTGVLPPRRRLAAAGALGAAAFCYATSENLPVGLLPVMSASLRSSLSATGLLVTVYAAVVVVTSAPLTYLTRNYPRRLLLTGLLGVFVAGTLAAAAAPGYGWLVAARVVTALSHAVFWSIVAVAAAGLFPAGERGRAVAIVASGGTLALLLGVPAGTWIGQHAGWRMSFVAVSGLGLAVAAAVIVLIPARRPSDNHAAAGTHPDALGYGLLVTTTFLAVAGTFCAYTYVSAFLTKVSGLPAGDVPPVLFLGGLASLTGVGCSGLISPASPGGTGRLDRNPGRRTARALCPGNRGPRGGGLAGGRELRRGRRLGLDASACPRRRAARLRHRVSRVLLGVQPRRRRWPGRRRACAVWARPAQHGPGWMAARQHGAGGGPQRTPRRRGHPPPQERTMTAAKAARQRATAVFDLVDFVRILKLSRPFDYGAVPTLGCVRGPRGWP